MKLVTMVWADATAPRAARRQKCLSIVISSGISRFFFCVGVGNGYVFVKRIDLVKGEKNSSRAFVFKKKPFKSPFFK